MEEEAAPEPGIVQLDFSPREESKHSNEDEDN
jgi:hypothetical protein